MIILVLTLIAHGSKCRTLAFEGGGTKGGFEAGAISAIVNNTATIDHAYDFVSGVSTGALNTNGFTIYPKGREQEAVAYILDIWRSINSSASFFVPWPQGYIYSLFKQPSLFSTAPLRKNLNEKFRTVGSRMTSVGVTNFDTGEYTPFYLNNTQENDLNYILASAAPPIVFPPQNFEGSTWADGGCTVNIDIVTPINWCLDQGFAQEDIIADFIFDNNIEIFQGFPEGSKTIGVWNTAKTIKSLVSSMSWVTNAIRAFPDVEYRYAVFPTKKLPGTFVPLDFNPKHIEDEIQLGISDALELIRNNQTGAENMISKFILQMGKVVHAD